jgi:hypothetical protein
MFEGDGMGKGKGFVASFRLELENIGHWRFLQVGASKLGGHSLLLVGSKEQNELYIPLGWFL